MSTCQIIILLGWLVRKNHRRQKLYISCFCSVLMTLTVIYLSIWFLTSRHHFLTSRYKDLRSQHIFLSRLHNYLKSTFQTVMLTCQTSNCQIMMLTCRIFMLTCQISCRLVRYFFFRFLYGINGQEYLLRIYSLTNDTYFLSK